MLKSLKPIFLKKVFLSYKITKKLGLKRGNGLLDKVKTIHDFNIFLKSRGIDIKLFQIFLSLNKLNQFNYNKDLYNFLLSGDVAFRRFFFLFVLTYPFLSYIPMKFSSTYFTFSGNSKYFDKVARNMNSIKEYRNFFLKKYFQGYLIDKYFDSYQLFNLYQDFTHYDEFLGLNFSLQGKYVYFEDQFLVVKNTWLTTEIEDVTTRFRLKLDEDTPYSKDICLNRFFYTEKLNFKSPSEYLDYSEEIQNFHSVNNSKEEYIESLKEDKEREEYYKKIYNEKLEKTKITLKNRELQMEEFKRQVMASIIRRFSSLNFKDNLSSTNILSFLIKLNDLDNKVLKWKLLNYFFTFFNKEIFSFIHVYFSRNLRYKSRRQFLKKYTYLLLLNFLLKIPNHLKTSFKKKNSVQLLATVYLMNDFNLSYYYLKLRSGYFFHFFLFFLENTLLNNLDRYFDDFLSISPILSIESLTVNDLSSESDDLNELQDQTNELSEEYMDFYITDYGCDVDYDIFSKELSFYGLKHLNLFFFFSKWSNSYKNILTSNLSLNFSKNKLITSYFSDEFLEESITQIKLNYLDMANILMSKGNELSEEYTIQYSYKVSEYRLYLTSINFLTYPTTLSRSQLFIFTTDNFIMNIKYFYPHIYNYFLAKLFFLENNSWKWLKVYLYDFNNFTSRFDKLLNFESYLRTNIVFSKFFSYLDHNIIQKKSKKIKLRRVERKFYKIVFFFLKKFFSKNNLVIFKRLNFDNLSEDLLADLLLIVQDDSFEVLRPNFMMEFLGVTISFFITKDPRFLVRWIFKILIEINYRKQWSFLYKLKFFLLKISQKFMEYTNLVGFYIVIKGKIGKLGSVRKKTFYIRSGSYGFSRYYLKGDEAFSYAHTQTGKIGIRAVVTYK